jgi:L-ascorbate metabolism protein UlaG (beta-lactamase superfamily)
MEIMTIKANDAGVGFLVKVDGLTLYHAGDHAGWLEGEKDGYTQEIDYLSDHVRSVDIAFLNVTGCHAHGEKPLWEGTCYTIDALLPRVVIPTHAFDREYIYKEYADKIQKEKYGIQVFCPENRGDKFFFCRKETS